MDNYLVSRDRAQRWFLGTDQEQVIRQWNLAHSEQWIYVDFLGRTYRICRTTGAVMRCWEDGQAGYEETLSVFDLLAHPGEGKYLSGQYAPVNSLKGSSKGAAVETGFYASAAAGFDRQPQLFESACRALGGEPVEMGDLGFRFPVFRDLNVILKFYRSDEDFPASVTLLWDENMLSFVYYETVFYIAGSLIYMIYEKMKHLQDE